VIKPPATNSSVSPDGRWIAYQAGLTFRAEIYVEPIPPTGEKHQITTAGGISPLWAPDGKQLFYLTPGPTGRIMAVEVQTQRGFSFGKTTPLPIEGIVNSGSRTYDITPDGKRFLVMVPKAQADPGKAPPRADSGDAQLVRGVEAAGPD
jgi:hypothetical protein